MYSDGRYRATSWAKEEGHPVFTFLLPAAGMGGLVVVGEIWSSSCYHVYTLYFPPKEFSLYKKK